MNIFDLSIEAVQILIISKSKFEFGRYLVHRPVKCMRYDSIVKSDECERFFTCVVVTEIYPEPTF